MEDSALPGAASTSAVSVGEGNDDRFLAPAEFVGTVPTSTLPAHVGDLGLTFFAALGGEDDSRDGDADSAVGVSIVEVAFLYVDAPCPQDALAVTAHVEEQHGCRLLSPRELVTVLRIVDRDGDAAPFSDEVRDHAGRNRQTATVLTRPDVFPATRFRVPGLAVGVEPFHIESLRRHSRKGHDDGCQGNHQESTKSPHYNVPPFPSVFGSES